MDRVSVKQAADLMKTSQQFVRIGLQRGILKFGYAVKLSSKWTYHISKSQLNQYLGIQN